MPSMKGKATSAASLPLKWHGGKSYLAKWIHSLSPPSVADDPKNGYTHRNIVFAGGLGEFWNWLPTEGVGEAVNDRNKELTNFWEVLASKEYYPEFARIVSCVPLDQNAWEAAKFWSEQSTEIVRRAAFFFIRYRQSRQGLGKDYATPTSRTRRGMNENVSAWLSAVEGLAESHARLRRVEIRNMDCLDFIRTYDHPRALFYCDPPYLHETRTSVREYGQHEMSQENHAALLDSLLRIEGKYMLSGYHSGLYDDWAVRFGIRCSEKWIDNKASSKAKKPQRVECIWMNF